MIETRLKNVIFIQTVLSFVLSRKTSAMKTYQMPNKWQYLTCIKVSFLNQNLQNDIVTPRL